MRVDRGEVVCVIGPSGSSKSTLLRCINLLEPPEEGRIMLEGKEITGAGAAEGPDFVRRHVGMVFQQFCLFPHKTALENVSLAQEKVLGRKPAECREKAEALLNRVGLGEKLREYPDRLSGGQQQRVAIARALAMDPHVMLFDEAGLAARGAHPAVPRPGAGALSEPGAERSASAAATRRAGSGGRSQGR